MGLVGLLSFVLFFAQLLFSLASAQDRVIEEDYRYAPAINTQILTDRLTEIAARIYRPAVLKGNHPLLIFLAGNHGTCGIRTRPRVDDNCQYTTQGTCPAGYTVAPSHLGYAYMARVLASEGYIVVSIDPNRGINCGDGILGDGGLVKARGRLILTHLQYLSEWNRGLRVQPPTLPVSLMHAFDFSHVGLMGHSRGGEGARAAYTFYTPQSAWGALIPAMRIRAIFEIGAVDGQSDTVFNASGTVWNQLLPMCDGDVFDLRGVRPFDRMTFHHQESPMRQKSTFLAWGTNHNYFNTEWQEGDSEGCVGHAPLFQPIFIPPDLPGSSPSPEPYLPPAWESKLQQKVGLKAVSDFFLANVGLQADPDRNQTFNPLFPIPVEISSVTRVDRAFMATPNVSVVPVVEDFRNGFAISPYGAQNNWAGIQILDADIPQHDVSLNIAKLNWTAGSSGSFFQTNWLPLFQGMDLSSLKTFEFRVSRASSLLNRGFLETDFSVALVYADNSLSLPVPVSAYASVSGPVGSTLAMHPILQAVRIPLLDFASPLQRVRGIRLIFDQTSRGELFFADLRMSSVEEWLAPDGLALGGGNIFENADYFQSAAGGPTGARKKRKPRDSHIDHVNAASPDRVEVHVKSQTAFKVGGALWELRVGQDIFSVSRFPSSGETTELIFSLPRDGYHRYRGRAHVGLALEGDSVNDLLDLGILP